MGGGSGAACMYVRSLQGGLGWEGGGVFGGGGYRLLCMTRSSSFMKFGGLRIQQIYVGWNRKSRNGLIQDEGPVATSTQVQNPPEERWRCSSIDIDVVVFADTCSPISAFEALYDHTHGARSSLTHLIPAIAVACP